MSIHVGTMEDRIFTRRRLWLFGRLIPALYLFMGVKFLVLRDWLIASDGSHLWTDFLAVWSAGNQALHHGAASIYGITALDALQKSEVSNLAGLHLPFAYPPTFLLIASPLGKLPYIAAFFVWQAATLLLFVAAIYLIIPRREAMVLALAFPAVFSNVFVGQEGLLAAALLGTTLALLERRPVLAGVLLGCLTFRPQLRRTLPGCLDPHRTLANHRFYDYNDIWHDRGIPLVLWARRVALVLCPCPGTRCCHAPARPERR